MNKTIEPNLARHGSGGLPGQAPEKMPPQVVVSIVDGSVGRVAAQVCVNNGVQNEVADTKDNDPKQQASAFLLIHHPISQTGATACPMTPDVGDEAVAYLFRGMRPDLNARRPASIACRMAAAI